MINKIKTLFNEYKPAIIVGGAAFVVGLIVGSAL